MGPVLGLEARITDSARVQNDLRAVAGEPPLHFRAEPLGGLITREEFLVFGAGFFWSAQSKPLPPERRGQLSKVVGASKVAILAQGFYGVLIFPSDVLVQPFPSKNQFLRPHAHGKSHEGNEG